MLGVMLVPLMPGDHPTFIIPPCQIYPPPETAAGHALGWRLMLGDEMGRKGAFYFCDYSIFSKNSPCKILCPFEDSPLLALCGIFSSQGLRNPPAVPGHGEASHGRQ